MSRVKNSMNIVKVKKVSEAGSWLSAPWLWRGAHLFSSSLSVQCYRRCRRPHLFCTLLNVTGSLQTSPTKLSSNLNFRLHSVKEE